VPPNVSAAVAKAIEKLPADRFESAKAFRDALDNPAFGYEATARGAGIGRGAAATGSGTMRSWLRDRRSAAAVAAASAMASLAAWAWLTRPPPLPPPDVMRFTIPTNEDAPLDFGGPWPDLAISPDGRTIVYQGGTPATGNQRLVARTLGDLSEVVLVGQAGGAALVRGPAISPDGRWVAFVADGATLQRVSVLGGTPLTLITSPQIAGIAWETDEWIVFGSAQGGLFRLPAGGGEAEPLTTLNSDEGDAGHVWPSVIDGANAVVFVVDGTPGPGFDGQLAVLDLESGEASRLGLEGISPKFVSTGHIVYAAEDGSVRAVPFDVRSLTVTGSPVPILEGVATKSSGAADFDVSRNGRLVYALGTAGALLRRTLVWVDRQGNEEAIAAEPRAYFNPRISPDARRVALDVREGDASIWIWDFLSETSILLGMGAGAHVYPTWTRDGQRVASVGGGSISWKASNNTGVPEMIVDFPELSGTPAGTPSPYFFTPDGALVFRDQANPETDDDLVMVSLEGDSVVWRLNGDFIERNAELSPDGRWMAYQSDESGTFQIYVRPFPDVQADQVVVSNNGGTHPLWSRDGRELFYLMPGGRQLMAVSVDAGDARTFVFRDRRVLMDWPYPPTGEGRMYDVGLDGRFLALKEFGTDGADAPEIHVVLNWFEELRERAGER
jgi:serine/threonine-protein kinase